MVQLLDPTPPLFFCILGEGALLPILLSSGSRIFLITSLLSPFCTKAWGSIQRTSSTTKSQAKRASTDNAAAGITALLGKPKNCVLEVSSHFTHIGHTWGLGVHGSPVFMGEVVVFSCSICLPTVFLGMLFFPLLPTVPQEM